MKKIMKKIILSILLVTSTTSVALASEKLCGVEVESCHIYEDVHKFGVNVTRASFKVDNAEIRECFTKRGAVIVGLFPNDEVRAVVIK